MFHSMYLLFLFLISNSLFFNVTQAISRSILRPDSLSRSDDEESSRSSRDDDDRRREYLERRDAEDRAEERRRDEERREEAIRDAENRAEAARAEARRAEESRSEDERRQERIRQQEEDEYEERRRRRDEEDAESKKREDEAWNKRYWEEREEEERQERIRLKKALEVEQQRICLKQEEQKKIEEEKERISLEQEQQRIRLQQEESLRLEKERIRLAQKEQIRLQQEQERICLEQEQEFMRFTQELMRLQQEEELRVEQRRRDVEQFKQALNNEDIIAQSVINIFYEVILEKLDVSLIKRLFKKRLLSEISAYDLQLDRNNLFSCNSLKDENEDLGSYDTISIDIPCFVDISQKDHEELPVVVEQGSTIFIKPLVSHENFLELLNSSIGSNNLKLFFDEQNNDESCVIYSGDQQIGILFMKQEGGSNGGGNNNNNNGGYNPEDPDNKNSSTKRNIIAGIFGNNITLKAEDVALAGAAGLGLTASLSSSAGGLVTTVGGVTVAGPIIPIVVGTAVVGYTIKLSIHVVRDFIYHVKRKRAEKTKKQRENDANRNNSSGPSKDPKDNEPDGKAAGFGIVANEVKKKIKKMRYTGSPKHTPNSIGNSSPPPHDGHKALQESVLIEIKDNGLESRIGVENGKIIKFFEQRPGEYHGFQTVEYKYLTPKEQAALQRGGFVRNHKTGKLKNEYNKIYDNR